MSRLKNRDIVAFPFYLLALIMLNICLYIGGRWTALRVITFMNYDVRNEVNKNHE